MSLYEGENIHQGFHDPMTGQDSFELQRARAKEERAEAEKRMKKFKSLTEHEGWQTLEEFLNHQIHVYMECLIKEQNVDKIRRLQEAIRCYNNVLIYPREQMIDETSFQPRTPDNGDNPQEE